jgi:hypothetical protein
MVKMIKDGFVKSPFVLPKAGLRFTPVAAAYPVSTPHSSGFARLASGAFYFFIPILSFYESIIKASLKPYSYPNRERAGY